MKQIDIKECHQRLLVIAKAFDGICTRHGIPYYMLGGTMLGAIRHKGFIPWDDDMDFGVPVTYYNELITLLEKELPENMRCCTYKNHPCVLYPFMKIEDKDTCIDDPRSNISLEKQLGINVDIFPLFVCDKSDKHLDGIFRLLRLQTIFNVGSTSKNILKSLVKNILRKILSNKTFFIDKIENRCAALSEGQYLGNVLGRWKRKEIIPMEWYGINVRYRFEDIELCGIKEYDQYLSYMYGDYMKLPKRNEQMTHCDNIYLRTFAYGH